MNTLKKSMEDEDYESIEDFLGSIGNRDLRFYGSRL